MLPSRLSHRILHLTAVAAATAICGFGQVACADTARLPVSAGTGPQPTLPEPTRSLIPTVNVAKAVGWPAGMQPQAAAGLTVQALATGLTHPRWLHVLPNGDVLVAESDAPTADAKGIKGWIMNRFMKRAGSKTPSADRITLLRDTNGDGVADVKRPFLTHLHSPFGMALVDDMLYVANADAIVRFPYKTGDTVIMAPGTLVTDLPGGPINHHWTKNIIAHPQGDRLYATVGSNSNVGENGLEAEAGRAAIWEIRLNKGGEVDKRLFATGLRNPNGMAFEPTTGVLWTVVNERDELGSDLVPDYLTSVQDGGFYGWPYSYYGQHVDKRVEPPRPDLVSKAIAPDYALGPHTASLGLCTAEGAKLGAAFTQGMFIGQHGSWNRRPHSGYKVIFVPFKDGRPSGAPLDVLTGFLSRDGQAYGRPVGVAIDNTGALLVADDVGDTIWRVTSTAAGSPR